MKKVLIIRNDLADDGKYHSTIKGQYETLEEARKDLNELYTHDFGGLEDKNTLRFLRPDMGIFIVYKIVMLKSTFDIDKFNRKKIT